MLSDMNAFLWNASDAEYIVVSLIQVRSVIVTTIWNSKGYINVGLEYHVKCE